MEVRRDGGRTRWRENASTGGEWGKFFAIACFQSHFHPSSNFVVFLVKHRNREGRVIKGEWSTAEGKRPIEGGRNRGRTRWRKNAGHDDVMTMGG